MSLIRFKYVLFGLTFGLLFLNSCSVSRYQNVKGYLEESSCGETQFSYFTNQEVPSPLHEIELDTILLHYFSERSLNVANSIHLLDLLETYVTHVKQLHEENTIENRLYEMELLQQIERKISLASLEISAVASELDCEEERINQVVDYLKKKEGNAESKLTVAAIGVGAIGAIGSGLLLSKGSKGEMLDVVGIITGVVEATLGVLILVNKRKVSFFHERNALREVWEGNQNVRIFPTSVWYYLTYYNPNLEGSTSIRSQINEKWMSFGQVAKSTSKKREKLIELYFGNGGKYTSEQLYNRANMYDQLESQIKLMKQELMLLSFELQKVNQR